MSPENKNLKSTQLKPPTWFSVVSAVSQVTFIEIMKDRVLYNIIVVALALFGFSYLVSNLTYGNPTRVVLDFGIASLAISCAGIAVFVGASLLSKEFERRTIYVAMSRPITRGQYVVGKYFGLSSVVFINWLLLAVVFFVIYATNNGDLSRHYLNTIGWGMLFILVQSLVFGALAIFFSTITTVSLTVVFTLGVYMVGINISQLRVLAKKTENPAVSNLLNGVSHLVPNFEHFNLGLNITYGLPVNLTQGGFTLAYGAVIVFILMFLSGILVKGKEA